MSTLLLALETATSPPSAALWNDGLLAERAGAPGRPGAETLLPAIDALLAGAGVALAEVDALAVSIGPGSFTGLRIGVATAQGLALGTPRRLVPVPTLAALARQASGPEPVAALLDARRGDVYAAGFEAGAPAAWLPESVERADALIARLPEGCRVVGEGADVCREALAAATARGITTPTPPAGWTPAREVAALGARALAAGRAVAADALVPRYLRRAEAEARRTGRPFEAF